MKKTLLLLTCITVFFRCYGQMVDLDKYSGLRAAGNIPEDFLTLSSEKYHADREQIDADLSNKEKKDRDNFLLESNFLIDNMLHSGHVIFGDPVTNYLNNIKNIILADDPKKRDAIRIYVLLSNDANAFTSDNGIVLVTTGLIAQAENEAQLAFVLCHEFNHYFEKHAITGYVENRRIERKSGIYSNLGNRDVNLEKFRYAKEQETEADKLGLELFSTTQYSYDAAENIFDVLLYSYLPFDEVAFPHNYFNNGYYQLPQNYFLDTVSSITAEEDYDDSENTHPNIKKRKSVMELAFMQKSDDGRKAFIQDEALFYNIRNACRFEGCNIYLNDIEYELALYQSFLLQKDFPGNTFLKNVEARALYGFARYKDEGALPDWHTYYKKAEGESQQVYHLFYSMNKMELDILALRNAWLAHLQDTDNVYIMHICEQLGSALISKHDLNVSLLFSAGETLDKMFAEPDTLAADSTAVSEEGKEDNSKTSKYEKIKKGSGKETKTEEKNKKPQYWQAAYADFMQDPAFVSLFKPEEEQEIRQVVKKNVLEKDAQPIEKMVVVDPLYVKVDQTKSTPIQYEAAEIKRLEIKDKVNASAKLLHIQLQYLDYNFLDANDVDKFNDLAILDRWIQERMDHVDEDVDVLCSLDEQFHDLGEKYGTEYFTWMGILSYKEPEHYVGGKIFLAIMLYPIAPFIIADLITPDNNTFFFALVSDADSGKIGMELAHNSRMTDKESILSGNIYYIMQQIYTGFKK
ncbi:MAG: M48 family metallopeptidase [Chitinophagales bacterium]